MRAIDGARPGVDVFEIDGVQSDDPIEEIVEADACLNGKRIRLKLAGVQRVQRIRLARIRRFDIGLAIGILALEGQLGSTSQELHKRYPAVCSTKGEARSEHVGGDVAREIPFGQAHLAAAHVGSKTEPAGEVVSGRRSAAMAGGRARFAEAEAEIAVTRLQLEARDGS